MKVNLDEKGFENADSWDFSNLLQYPLGKSIKRFHSSFEFKEGFSTIISIFWEIFTGRRKSILMAIICKFYYVDKRESM